MRVWTNDPMASPVTAQELADCLRLDDATDPTLPGRLKLATQLVENYLNLSLLPKTFNLVYSQWPTLGTTAHGLKASCAQFASVIGLPFAAFELVEVLAVTLYGEASADWIVTAGQPATLSFTSLVAQLAEPVEPAIVIEYRSGYDVATASTGSAETAVPDAIKQALLDVAAYLFKNRGACEVSNAIKDSGAEYALYPFRQSPVVM